MLHGVIRVGDLDETKKFLEAVGLKSLRERDVPDDKFSNAFYGFGPEQHGEHFSLELTYNYGVKSYDLGNGFGYFGVAVPDASVTVDRVRGAGFNVASDASSEGKFFFKTSHKLAANSGISVTSGFGLSACFSQTGAIGQ